MSILKSLINTFVVAAIAMIVVSCVPKATEKKAICGTNQAFDTITRSCYSTSAVRVKPVGTKSSDSLLEEKPQLITLTYTDGNNDKALSCKVTNVSSNVEIISPFVTDGGLFLAADELATAIVSTAGAMPSPDTAAAATARAAMQAALAVAKATAYYPTLVTQVGIFKTQAATVLTLAAAHTGDVTLQSYATVAQEKMDTFSPVLSQTTDRCECSAGVCSTMVIPRMNKSGTAGFSYTVTDVDGESAVKAVTLTVTPMSRTTPHLAPVAESSYYIFNESATSTPTAYTIAVPTATDALGTVASSLQYSIVTAPAKGTLTNCMNLTGSSGVADSICTYTPTSGDTNDSVTVTRASAVIGNLTFYAKNFGAAGNNYSVRLFDLHADNSAYDAYVTATESFGMSNSSYGESFIRMNGNTIRIFINPNVTTTDDIVNLIAAHPQASSLIYAVSSATSYPSASSLVSLTGGTDAFDTFTYKVSNGLGGTSSDAIAMIKINPVNDAPIAPKTLSSVYSHSETLLEEETGHAVILDFKDVDSYTTSFTIDVKVDTVTPTCSSAMTNADFTVLTTSTNFTVPATTTGVASCTTAGVCTQTISIAANLDFSGSACLYYRVTDLSGAISEIQPVNLTVTNVNDAPLLSSVAFVTSTPAAPDGTALVDTVTKEDLEPTSTSYASIYAAPGGNSYEAAQTMTLTASSSNTTLIPNTVCQNYTPYAGTPVGAVVPAAIGLVYFDTTNFRCYISTGSSLNTDWALKPSLTVFPNCAYDYYGQGTPIGSVAATVSGKHYLDTTNNKCYISDLTLTAGWKQDVASFNYKISYVPTAEQSGLADITVTAKDSGGVLNSGVDTTTDIFQVNVQFVNDPPFFDSTNATAIHTNEGGAVQSDAFYVDEDKGRTTDENAQNVRITSIVSDNPSVLPASAITVFYDLNDNGVEDSGESRAIGVNLEDPSDAMDSTKNDVHLHAFYLKLDPVDGVSGNANITITVSDDDSTNPQTASTQISFIVHPVAALHGGWNNISSIGIKTDKSGTPVTDADIQCNYNKSTDTKRCAGADCTGTASPHSVIVPEAANVIYWDSSAKRCYRSTGTTQYSWVDFMTSCPVTRETGICSGENCITSTAAPYPLNSVIPTKVGTYYYNTNNNTCYVSTAKVANTNWEVYVPSKINLAWKSFTLVGSGASSAAQISGWNVYRRESGTDFNFKGGHLKNSSSTTVATITDPTVRTFTDTTAVAGKVYYYVVRPIDSLRSFPTYTPEIFSEVRVLASPANYSFVHRWIVNQEICNGMKITTTSTTRPSNVDPTKNFRCQYKGPGESTTSVGYYDYGRDLLVDSYEMGCPYAAAPKCSANGCVGIGAPSSTTNVVTNDLYYDRNSGTCYRYNGGWATVEATSSMAAMSTILNTALNAPLVNVTEAKAATICSARTNPTVASNVTLGSAILPSKKDFIAYASHKFDMIASDITDLEQGLSLNLNSRCNGSSASGLTTAYTDSTIPSTSFIYSLPGTATSGIKSIYTGSIPWGLNKGTESCVSRFGIQDLYGNVAEWTTDKMKCASQYVCTSDTMSASYSDYMFGTTLTTPTPTPYAFDYLSGPYYDANGDGIADNTTGPPYDAFLTEWTYSAGSFNASKFSYPVGLPINGDIATAYPLDPALDFVLEMGPSSGIVPEDLHEDGIIVNGATVYASSTKIGSFAVGGSYLSGQRAGRFTSELIPETTSRVDVGFRCIIPIDSTSGYPSSAASGHTYPY
jgi:hypothetical protein